MQADRDLTETVWRRHDFLQTLSTGPKTKEQLTQELGYAEQTIYKRIRELKQHSLVKQKRNRYHLTLQGHLVHRKYTKLEETTENRKLLNKPQLNQQLQPELLTDAEIVEREGSTPRKPMRFYDEKFAESTKAEAMTSTLLSPSRIEAHEQFMGRDGTIIRGIFQSKVLDYLLSEHREVIKSNILSGNLEAWVTQHEIPLPVIILDNSEVLILVFDSTGATKGTVSIQEVIHNNSTAAVNWAKQQFKETKKKSTKLKPEDVTQKH